MSIRKLSALLLALATLLIAASAEAVDYKTKLTLHIAASSTYDEAYELTVPGETAITTSGWNSLGNITAKYSGTNSGFKSEKKLVVTATSTHTTENGFYLASTTTGVTDTISYYVATGENDTAATTTFEFTADEINAKDTNDAFVGTSKPIGVNVEDYSSKSAGDYEDEITYEVSVENAATTRTVTWTASDINSDPTVTKDGVTLTAGSIDTNDKNILNGGTFTVASGNFTKIVVTANDTSLIGFDKNYNTIAGWSDNTWTGNASSVQCGTIMGNGQNITIVFTIEE